MAKPHDLTIIRFYADPTGVGWQVSSAESLRAGSAALFGPIRIRAGSDALAGSLRQNEGRPERSDMSLGDIHVGDGLQVAINWRMPAKASGGRTVHEDYLALLLWTTQDWEMMRPSQLTESMHIRDIDLRSVLY